MIVLYAEPKAQVQALHVSTAWRSSALSTISSSTNPFRFRTLDTHAPVEYGQSLEDTSAAPQLSPGELDESLSNFHMLMRRREKSRDIKCFYFPARFTQFCDLPDNVANVINELYADQAHLNMIAVPLSTGSRWLDLGHFSVNPYFQQLFQGSVRATT